MKVYYKFNPIEKDDSPKTGDTNQVINRNCRFMLKDSELRMVIYNIRTEAGEKSLPPFFCKKS